MNSYYRYYFVPGFLFNIILLAYVVYVNAILILVAVWCSIFGVWKGAVSAARSLAPFAEQATDLVKHKHKHLLFWA